MNKTKKLGKPCWTYEDPYGKKWAYHTESGKPMTRRQLKSLHKNVLDPVHKIVFEEIRQDIREEKK